MFSDPVVSASTSPTLAPRPIGTDATTDGHEITAASTALAPVVIEQLTSASTARAGTGAPALTSPFAPPRPKSPPTSIAASRLSTTNSEASSGETPQLIKLAQDGKLKAIEALVSGGRLTPSEIVDQQGANALHWAAGQGHLAVVRWCLEKGGFDINTQDANGRTALHWVVGDPRVRDARPGVSAAAREGVIELLLQKKGLRLSAQDRNGHTPVAMAALDNETKVYGLIKDFIHGKESDIAPSVTDDRRSIRSGFRSIASRTSLMRKSGRASSEASRTSTRGAPVVKAAASGNLADLQAFLKAGFSPNEADEEGRTALHFAAARGELEMANALLGKGAAPSTGVLLGLIARPRRADPNQQTRKGETPLMWAIIFQQPLIVKRLCEDDRLELDRPMLTGQTALMIAAWRGEADFVALLLTRGAAASKQDDNDNTALRLAAGEGHTSCIEHLLQPGVIAPDDLRSGQGALALIDAAREGHEAAVAALAPLVDCAFQVDNGDTALLWAASRNHHGVIRLLLERLGDDPAALEAAKVTAAFFLAAARGHQDSLQYLLPHVAIDAQDDKGETALLKATRSGSHGVFEVLLANGANPDLGNVHGEVPLHFAVLNDDAMAVEALLNANADPHAGEPELPTPLTLAAQRGLPLCIPSLLRHDGINANHRDADGAGGSRGGRTAIFLGATFGHADIVALLLKEPKVDPTLPDAVGNTVLHVAASGGHMDTLRHLLADPRISPLLNAVSGNGTTALLEAASGGHGDTVQWLLKQPGISTDIVDQSGRTAASYMQGQGAQSTGPTSPGGTPAIDAHALYRARKGARDDTPLPALTDGQIAALKHWLGFPAMPGGEALIASSYVDGHKPKRLLASHHLQAEALAWFVTELEGETQRAARKQAIDVLNQVLKAAPEHAKRSAAAGLETLAEGWDKLDDESRMLALDKCFAPTGRFKLRADDGQALWIYLCDTVLPKTPPGQVRNRVIALLIDIYDHAMQGDHWERGETLPWMPPLDGYRRLGTSLEEAEGVQRPDIASRLRPRLQLAVRVGQIQASGLYWRGQIPEGLGELGEMSEINFSNNLIDSLPDDIGSWKLSGKLDLSGNRLRSLPEGIGKLEGLTEIDLSHNRLKSLPHDIDDWPAGLRIKLDGNPHLPAALVEYVVNGRKHGAAMAKLAHHPGLQAWLRIGNPQHEEAEEAAALEMGRCLDHESATLSFRGLGLERWPHELLADARFTAVAKLDLSGNRLKNPAGLEHLPDLQELNLRGCTLDDPTLIAQLMNRHGCTLHLDEAGLSAEALAYVKTAPSLGDVATIHLHREHGVSVLMPREAAQDGLAAWGNAHAANYRTATELQALHQSGTDELLLAQRGLKDMPTGLFGLFPGIRKLDLHGNSLETLEPLDALPQLEELDLGDGNRLRQLDGLGSLSKLRVLELDRLPLTGELNLEGLTQLTRLFVQNTAITGLRGLGRLERLSFIDVSGCESLDLACMAALPRNCQIRLGDDLTTRSELARRGELFPKLAQDQVEACCRSTEAFAHLDFGHFGLKALPQGLEDLLRMPGKQVAVALQGNHDIAATELFALLSRHKFAAVDLDPLDLSQANVPFDDPASVERLLTNLSESELHLSESQLAALRAHEGRIALPPTLPTLYVDGKLRGLSAAADEAATKAPTTTKSKPRTRGLLPTRAPGSPAATPPTPPNKQLDGWIDANFADPHARSIVKKRVWDLFWGLDAFQAPPTTPHAPAAAAPVLNLSDIPSLTSVPLAFFQLEPIRNALQHGSTLVDLTRTAMPGNDLVALLDALPPPAKVRLGRLDFRTQPPSRPDFLAVLAGRCPTRFEVDVVHGPGITAEALRQAAGTRLASGFDTIAVRLNGKPLKAETRKGMFSALKALSPLRGSAPRTKQAEHAGWIRAAGVAHAANREQACERVQKVISKGETELNLTGLKLYDFPNNLFAGGAAVTKLVLSGNALDRLPDLTLLPNLATLVIQGNTQDLHDLDLRAPTTLTTLTITESRLGGSLDLSKYPRLQHVDLEYNRLSALQGLSAAALSLKSLSCFENRSLLQLPEGLEHLAGCDEIKLAAAFRDDAAAGAALDALLKTNPGLRIKFDPLKAPSIKTRSAISTTGGLLDTQLLGGSRDDAARSWSEIEILLRSQQRLQERIDTFQGPVRDYFLTVLGTAHAALHAAAALRSVPKRPGVQPERPALQDWLNLAVSAFGSIAGAISGAPPGLAIGNASAAIVNGLGNILWDNLRTAKKFDAWNEKLARLALPTQLSSATMSLALGLTELMRDDVHRLDPANPQRFRDAAMKQVVQVLDGMDEGEAWTTLPPADTAEKIKLSLAHFYRRNQATMTQPLTADELKAKLDDGVLWDLPADEKVQLLARHVPEVLIHERRKILALEDANQALQADNRTIREQNQRLEAQNQLLVNHVGRLDAQYKQLGQAMQQMLALPEFADRGPQWKALATSLGAASTPGSDDAPTPSVQKEATPPPTTATAPTNQATATNSTNATLPHRASPITLADGSEVPGFLVRASATSDVELPAFRVPEDPMGYHEAQQGSQCGRQTLNMVDPGPVLATEEDYRLFLTTKFETERPRKTLADGSYRDATDEEVADMVRSDTGASLYTIAEFQAWRRLQGASSLPELKAGVGNLDHLASLDEAQRDLQGAEAFGVGYQKKGKTAHHNVAIRRVDGRFRLYDSQRPNLPELVGNTAFEALRSFVTTHVERVTSFGLQFEYLVAKRSSE